MTAEEGLYDLISFIGSFIISPLWFGLSVLQLMAIAFIVHFIIGILLGGIEPRSNFERTSVPIARAKPTDRKTIESSIKPVGSSAFDNTIYSNRLNYQPFKK